MIKVMVLTFDRVIKFILVAFKPVLLPGIMDLLVLPIFKQKLKKDLLLT